MSLLVRVSPCSSSSIESQLLGELLACAYCCKTAWLHEDNKAPKRKRMHVVWHLKFHPNYPSSFFGVCLCVIQCWCVCDHWRSSPKLIPSGWWWGWWWCCSVRRGDGLISATVAHCTRSDITSGGWWGDFACTGTPISPSHGCTDSILVPPRCVYSSMKLMWLTFCISSREEGHTHMQKPHVFQTWCVTWLCLHISITSRTRGTATDSVTSCFIRTYLNPKAKTVTCTGHDRIFCSSLRKNNYP